MICSKKSLKISKCNSEPIIYRTDNRKKKDKKITVVNKENKIQGSPHIVKTGRLDFSLS